MGRMMEWCSALTEINEISHLNRSANLLWWDTPRHSLTYVHCAAAFLKLIPYYCIIAQPHCKQLCSLRKRAHPTTLCELRIYYIFTIMASLFMYSEVIINVRFFWIRIVDCAPRLLSGEFKINWRFMTRMHAGVSPFAREKCVWGWEQHTARRRGILEMLFCLI